VRTLVEDAELSRTLRGGARKCAEEKFSSAHVAARVEALYRRLLS
jgi:hypothetical protein